MPLDMNRARERMRELSKERKDYSKISYGLKQGQNVLRFVTPPGRDWPFIYGQMYYKIKKQYFISPSMYEDPDPIKQQLDKLKSTGREQDAAFAKKYYPSRRVFALAVVRGQQDKGIVWVDFPKKVEKQLITFILNQEYGDITDIHKGTDFIITKRKGASFPEYSVTPKRNVSALFDSDQKIKSVMQSIPEFKDAFKHYSYSELQSIWESFINGDDVAQTTSTDQDEEAPIEEEQETVNVTEALQRFKNKKAATT